MARAACVQGYKNNSQSLDVLAEQNLLMSDQSLAVL